MRLFACSTGLPCRVYTRRQREVNAHLLLDGQPRVVQVLHTFQGVMVGHNTVASADLTEQHSASSYLHRASRCCPLPQWVPPTKDDAVQQPRLLEVRSDFFN